MRSHLIKPLFIGLLTLSLLAPAVKGEELTLDQALEIALVNSPTMRGADFNLSISEHNLDANLASLKSKLNLTVTPYQFSKNRVFNDLASSYITQEQTTSSASFSVTQPITWTDGILRISEDINWKESFSSFTGTEKETSYRNSFVVTLNQPLFSYNRTKLQLKELRLSLENSRLNFAIQKLQIESRVTQQFLNLFYRQQSVAITEQEFTNAQASYDIIKSKVDAGISALEELYQADLTMANSRASLQNSRMQYEEALDNFNILLGVDLDQQFEINAAVEKNIVDINLDHALESGINNRMEIRQRNIDLQKAYHSLIRTGADNEFKADLRLSYGLTGTDPEFGDLYKSPNRDQSVSLSFNIPLFDWGEKKHRMNASRLGLENSELNLSEEKRQITIEIRQAFRNLQNQKLQIEIAEKNVKNATLTYEINLERYKNGDLSSKDIGFYQNQLSSEQLNEISALINYQIALLDLKIRSLWDFRTDQPVVTSTLMGNNNE